MYEWLFGVILILIVIYIWYISQGTINFPSNNTGKKDTAREVLYPGRFGLADSM